MNEDLVIDALTEAKTLGMFKKICDKNASAEARIRLRNIYDHSSNAITTTKNLILNELELDVSTDQARRLTQLILAFLKKSTYRKPISKQIKQNLLYKQKNRCAICNCGIDLTAHADHIVPFKYVGDELEDNLQMLCADCNLKKNASIDFQIRFFLGLV